MPPCPPLVACLILSGVIGVFVPPVEARAATTRVDEVDRELSQLEERLVGVGFPELDAEARLELATIQEVLERLRSTLEPRNSAVALGHLALLESIHAWLSGDFDRSQAQLDVASRHIALLPDDHRVARAADVQRLRLAIRRGDDDELRQAFGVISGQPLGRLEHPEDRIDAFDEFASRGLYVDATWSGQVVAQTLLDSNEPLRAGQIALRMAELQFERGLERTPRQSLDLARAAFGRLPERTPNTDYLWASMLGYEARLTRLVRASQPHYRNNRVAKLLSRADGFGAQPSPFSVEFERAEHHIALSQIEAAEAILLDYRNEVAEATIAERARAVLRLAKLYLDCERTAEATELRPEIERLVAKAGKHDVTVGGLAILAQLAHESGDDRLAVETYERREKLQVASETREPMDLLALSARISRASLSVDEQLTRDLDREKNHADNLLTILLGSGIIGALLGIGGWLLTSRLKRSNASLSQHAEESQDRKNRAEETLAYISHDLRSPLTTIRAATEVLSHGLDDKQKHLLSIIEGGSQRMEEMIESTLVLMQFNQGQQNIEDKTSVFSLGDLLEDLAAEATRRATDRQVTVRLLGGPTEMCVRTHQLLLQQVLENLISNAVKFSPNSGLVTVKIERQLEATAIVVTDSGPGISQEEFDRLWSLFGRGKNQPEHISTKSIGVGLTLARTFAEALGCRIHVDDPRVSPAKGASFRVDISAIVHEEEPSYELSPAGAPAELSATKQS